MAWSWSHTPEAIENFATNVRRMPREWLLTVWSEWVTHERGQSEDIAAYDAAKDAAKDASDEALAERIIVRAEQQATCTNGGWEAWSCPHGCGCHLVSFDVSEED